MKRLLVITLLDYRKKPNNRIQHTVKALLDEYDEAWLLCRNQPYSGNVFAKFKNILPLPVQQFNEGKLHILEYSPPLNYLGTYLAVEDDQESVNWFTSLINFVGLIRELLFSFTILYVAIRYLRGSFFLCVVETSWEGIIALFLRSIGKIKYVVFDDNDFNPGFMRNRMRRRYTLFMEKYCIRSSDRVIAVGHLLAEFWRRETGKEIRVIPNGVNTTKFRSEKRNREGKHTNLVYVGTLSSSWVDMNLILDSLKILLTRKFEISFTVVGTASQRYIETLKAQLCQNGLDEHVELVGMVDHDKLPDILRRCDIGLAVSPVNLIRRFAFPLKVVEYMAMGLPVIGTKGTETEWIIDHYKVGKSIHPVIEDLCDALTFLVEDRDYYQRCSANAISGARDFDLEKLADQRRNEMFESFLN